MLDGGGEPGVGRLGEPGSAAVLPIQWLRFFFRGGLITPAMWPDAPRTKRRLPFNTCVLR